MSQETKTSILTQSCVRSILSLCFILTIKHFNLERTQRTHTSPALLLINISVFPWEKYMDFQC